MIVEISTDDLIDPQQIGWIAYREGNAVVRVKVVRAKSGKPFLAHVRGVGGGSKVRVIEYENRPEWLSRADYMLKQFRETVGEQHWRQFRAEDHGEPRPAVQSSSR